MSATDNQTRSDVAVIWQARFEPLIDVGADKARSTGIDPHTTPQNLGFAHSRVQEVRTADP